MVGTIILLFVPNGWFSLENSIFLMKTLFNALSFKLIKLCKFLQLLSLCTYNNKKKKRELIFFLGKKLTSDLRELIYELFLEIFIEK